MKILYLSCHSILEYDEIKLFTQLGHQVFSVAGSYQNPKAPVDIKRPGFNGFYDDQLSAVALQSSKENLHPELIAWADVVYIMHRPDWVLSNWQKIKHKKVVWRSIGQSVESIESTLAYAKTEGMKIVRYSPAEIGIPKYIGHDAIIRFYKNKDEFSCYHGSMPTVMTVCQSMPARKRYCGYDYFMDCTEGFSRVIFGPSNEAIPFNGGQLSYDDLKDAYRKHRCYFYTGTYPASYTLNFIEAMMTGIPIVAIGRELANVGDFPNMETYEVESIIKHGINGFCSNDKRELKANVQFLLENREKAIQIGARGRETAIELFEENKIKNEWNSFFKSL